MSSAHVLSFGKYRGMHLSDIVESDVDYVQWLVGQSWFRARFSDIHRALVDIVDTHAPQATCLGARLSPARNRMQNLFLQREFAASLVACTCSKMLAHEPSSKASSIDAHAAAEEFADITGYRLSKLVDDNDVVVADYGWNTERGAKRTLRMRRRDDIVADLDELEADDGWDASLVVRRCFLAGTYTYSAGVHGKEDAVARWGAKHGVAPHADMCACAWHIVLRPLLCDEYPALLRCMRQRATRGTHVVLLVGRYEREDVTSREEMRAMFRASSGWVHPTEYPLLSVVFLDELADPRYLEYWTAPSAAKYPRTIALT